MALTFSRWDYTSDLSPTAVLDPADPCGIYVLEFVDGSEYVGQAIDVRRRLATHRRTHTDIVAVRFTPVRRQDLSDSEYALIQDRQARGIALRNKAMVSNFVGASLLDLVVDQQVQAEWLEADPEVDDIVIGERAEIAARRARSQQ